MQTELIKHIENEFQATYYDITTLDFSENKAALKYINKGIVGAGSLFYKAGFRSKYEINGNTGLLSLYFDETEPPYFKRADRSCS